MAIDVRNISFSYGNGSVLSDVSFRAESGELIALLGPNGVGKSTLFRLLLGFLKPSSGEILIDGKRLGDFSRRELAAELAYIPQSYSPAFNHSVLDSVLMGLTGRLGVLGQPGEAERKCATDALESLGIGRLADRGAMKISGGERQLMLIARAMVQNAKLLLMDEPTANLDYGNSFRMMEKIESLRSRGYTVFFSTHEPNQAFRYATRIITLKDGRILSDGAPADTLTPDILRTLYGVNVRIVPLTIDGRPYSVCFPDTEPASPADRP